MALVLQKAKAGCIGCYYENKEKCPVDKEEGTRDFSQCTDPDTHDALIFVKQENSERQIES